jgi:uncharacterized integral membrane protein
MSAFLILLGLVAAGVVADFIAENGLNGPDQSFQLVGSSFHLPTSEVVLAAAVLGALAVTVIALGIWLLRGSRGRRRGMKSRVADLERENTELRSKVHLEAVLDAKPGNAGHGEAK